jgi:trans-aconitate methyltransferase
MNDRVKWDPADYAASSSSQARWGRELMERVEWRGDEHVLDVGCGDGTLTAQIASRVSQGRVLGIDSSAEMVAHAQATHLKSHFSNLRFVQMDAARMELPPTFDVVFSNAALHWVADQKGVLQGAARALQPGGRLVVSCGGKGNAEDVFVALRREMRSARWREYFRNLKKPYFFHGDDEYREWLEKAGFQALHLRLMPKAAVHEDESAFESWLRTTWMPYTHRVPESSRAAFIQAVVQRYLEAHPPDATGAVHVRMVRLELDAVRV